MSFRAIIDLWPSRAAFASDVGATAQAVWNMYDRDSIPARYWAVIVEKADERALIGVTLQHLANAAAGRTVAA